MATLEPYETKSGRRWRVRYRTPDRRQTDKRGFTTKRAAERFARTVEVSKDRGEYLDPAAGRVTVSELGAVWLRSRSHLKPSTARGVESAWRVHVKPKWGARRPADIRFSEVESWVAEMAADRSPTTVRRAHGVLLSVLDGAVKDRRIRSNPAAGVGTLPRRTRRPHVYLSHEQLHALAEEAGEHRTMVLLLGYTGIRWGEMAGLRVRDLDLERRRVRVERNAVEVGSVIEVGTPKTHKLRSVPLAWFLVPLLRQHVEGRDPDALVFTSPSGTFIRRPKLSEAVSTGENGRRRAGDGHSWYSAALGRAGLDHMTIHDLRHTAASLAISAGANVKAVQRMLGHASAAMTLDTYADLFDDDLDAVGAALHHAASATSVGRMWADDAATGR